MAASLHNPTAMSLKPVVNHWLQHQKMKYLISGPEVKLTTQLETNNQQWDQK